MCALVRPPKNADCACPRNSFGKSGCRSRIGVTRIARRYALPIDAGEYAFVGCSPIGCFSYSSSSFAAISAVIVDVLGRHDSMSCYALFAMFYAKCLARSCQRERPVRQRKRERTQVEKVTSEDVAFLWFSAF